MTGLSAIAVTWPLAISMAVVTVQGIRTGRRRTALNRAIHELRRPLQAIALAVHSRSLAPEAVESAVQLAAKALEQLERELNGGGPTRAEARPVQAGRPRAAVAMQPVIEAAVGRWEERARSAGGSISLKWTAGTARVDGDAHGLAQAVDNLIVNAIEHGGPTIVVEARRRDERLRLSVADCGRTSAAVRLDGRSGVLAWLSGRRRHGHGLPVVRRVAATHGGRFALSRSSDGSLAVLELPLAVRRVEISA